jgi:hypothetical protein
MKNYSNETELLQDFRERESKSWVPHPSSFKDLYLATVASRREGWDLGFEACVDKWKMILDPDFVDSCVKGDRGRLRAIFLFSEQQRVGRKKSFPFEGEIIREALDGTELNRWSVTQNETRLELKVPSIEMNRPVHLTYYFRSKKKQALLLDMDLEDHKIYSYYDKKSGRWHVRDLRDPFDCLKEFHRLLIWRASGHNIDI